MLLIEFAVAVVVLVWAFVSFRRKPPRTAARMELVMVYISSAWALLVSLLILFVPVYGSTHGSVSTDGVIAISTHRETLLAVNGPGSLVPLTLLVIAASLPLLFRKSRWRAVIEASAAVLLVGFTIVGGFSIGLFYLPSALAMLAAGCLASFTPAGEPGRGVPPVQGAL